MISNNQVHRILEKNTLLAITADFSETNAHLLKNLWDSPKMFTYFSLFCSSLPQNNDNNNDNHFFSFGHCYKVNMTPNILHDFDCFPNFCMIFSMLRFFRQVSSKGMPLFIMIWASYSWSHPMC